MNLSWLFIILGAMMWGIDGVLLTPRYFQYGLYNVLLIVFIAHLLPFLFMLITQRGSIKEIKKMNFYDKSYFLLIALFGGTIGTLSIVKALQLSEFNPYSLVILIQKSQPIFAILSAYFILKEKITYKFKIVFVISLISLYFLTFGLNSPFEIELKSIYSAIYSLIAAISFGLSTTFSRKVAIKYNANLSTFIRFMFTAIITFILLLLNIGQSKSDIIYVVKNNHIMLLALFIAIWNLIASNLYYKGLQKTKAIYSTVSELSFPLTSVFIDMFILGNVLDPIRILAGSVLLLSIVYLNLNNE
ncbi:DMT family transporter [Streptobacillus moniliformis]|uniref:DMT family transporter n=1 Tax=Streptobacillus moniliformis TaxID=34105 RepID=UPI0007E4BD8A|nr:DMT family transporter [Streptobacillus moniliformis]